MARRLTEEFLNHGGFVYNYCFVTSITRTHTHKHTYDWLLWLLFECVYCRFVASLRFWLGYYLRLLACVCVCVFVRLILWASGGKSILTYKQTNKHMHWHIHAPIHSNTKSLSCFCCCCSCWSCSLRTGNDWAGDC